MFTTFSNNAKFCATPGCGDGKRTGSEGCDDGGSVVGDGCSAACSVESGYVCAPSRFVAESAHPYTVSFASTTALTAGGAACSNCLSCTFDSSSQLRVSHPSCRLEYLRYLLNLH